MNWNDAYFFKPPADADLQAWVDGWIEEQKLRRQVQAIRDRINFKSQHSSHELLWILDKVEQEANEERHRRYREVGLE